jgi:hypothetical protein
MIYRIDPKAAIREKDKCESSTGVSKSYKEGGEAWAVNRSLFAKYREVSDA